MAAIVTDQFRILNASNFVDSISNNSYYTFLGLVNSSPAVSAGFGRDTNWDTNPPSPIDNFQYYSHYKETALFGKKIKSSNVRRVIRRVDWVANNKYDMYRHDYSATSRTPYSNSSRLYDSNFYVMNSDFRVYICLYNGSSGVSGDVGDPHLPNESLDEPTFTDLEPSAAGTSNDGYIWKYLFSISPSDIIKFDSTEYIAVPNDWATSVDAQIVSVREAGNSNTNLNQIKQVYIEKIGSAYEEGTHTCDILGDGSGGKVSVVVNDSGEITSANVISGGSGYTYGIVDLGRIQVETITSSNAAKLIPIIPPSKGHGYDIYTELGADKVLIYTRFDNSDRDFPTDTNFSQVGILKNPEQRTSTTTFSENQFSSLYSLMVTGSDADLEAFSPTIGQKISQSNPNSDPNIPQSAQGYVASYDKTTKVLKYSRDRSLYFSNKDDQTDNSSVSTQSKIYDFNQGWGNLIFDGSSSNISIKEFSGISTTVNNSEINLGVEFVNGLASPEINNKTGDLIYIDNRPEVTRDIRQKEDVKIILEF